MLARSAVVGLGAIALLAGGCGGDDGKSSASGSSGPGSAAPGGAPREKRQSASRRAGPTAPSGTIVRVARSQYGAIVGDGRGQAFYLFGREKSKRSRCYGECAARWPPVLTKGTPRALTGARQRLLGTTPRRDGRLQVTYAGHPMYYYDGDSPGRILCQSVTEFGGLWLVVKPNGQPVR